MRIIDHHVKKQHGNLCIFPFQFFKQQLQLSLLRASVIHENKTWHAIVIHHKFYLSYNNSDRTKFTIDVKELFCLCVRKLFDVSKVKTLKMNLDFPPSYFYRTKDAFKRILIINHIIWSKKRTWTFCNILKSQSI